jgi:hypothetical protein
MLALYNKKVLTNAMIMIWTCLTATVFVKFKSTTNYPTFLTGACKFLPPSKHEYFNKPVLFTHLVQTDAPTNYTTMKI